MAFADGLPIDRLLCMPFVSDHSYRLMGGPIAKYYNSAQLMAEAQINAFRIYGHDSVGDGPGLFGIAEAMGTKLTYPEDGIPFVAEPILRDYAAIDMLPEINPRSPGRLLASIQSLEILEKAIGNEVSVGCSFGGPVTTAAAVRGTELFLKDLVRNPSMAHQLLKISTENILRLVDAFCDIGIKPGICEPVASGTIIAARQFREFAAPYLKLIADRIKARFGSGPFLHICGDTTRILTDMADIGASILSLDNQIDLAVAKKEVGDRVCLAGNVKPADTLWRGSRDDVFAEVKECIRKAGDSPKGYIVSSGCGLPLATPQENVHAMMDAVRLYGKMPINL